MKTEKQKQQVRDMYNALKTIAKDYQSANQITRNSERDYGLEPQEALEMSYENIQSLAKKAIKGISIEKIISD